MHTLLRLVLGLAVPALALATPCDVTQSLLSPYGQTVQADLVDPFPTALNWTGTTSYGSCATGQWSGDPHVWLLACPGNTVQHVTVADVDGCGVAAFQVPLDAATCDASAECARSTVLPAPGAGEFWLSCPQGATHYLLVDRASPAPAGCIPTSAGYELTAQPIEHRCGDGFDNDANGFVDGFDPDCASVGTLRLDLPEQVQAGGPLTLEVTGATPGSRVYVAADQGALSGQGVCPSALAGACLALRAPRLVGSTLADAAGRGAITVIAPARLPQVMTFQAVSRSPVVQVSAREIRARAP